MKLSIPKLSLVVLIGPSGSGKTTLAHRHFLSTEIISSDACRAMLSDDENDMAVTKDAFELVHFIAGKRLASGRLAVIDATNVQRDARKPLIQLAREHHALPVAIVLNLPEKVCRARNKERSDRNFGPHVIRQHRSQLRRSLKGLKREGFRHVYIMDFEEVVNEASVERVPLWNDKRDEHGPFDIIGDVHGCADELMALLEHLGYEAYEHGGEPFSRSYRHPEGRRAVFLGDVVDRGPRIIDTLSIVMNMLDDGHALCVPGNHENKLKRKLQGKKPALTHGLDRTMAELEALPDEIREPFMKKALDFIDGLISHYVFDDGKFVVAHAGLKEEMQGRGSGRVREFALYGETTGETDEFGLPVRHNWASEYRGRATVVYGHTPVPEPLFLNRTVNIDTGCVFGGYLTAFRYPEQETISVPAAEVYAEPAKPLDPNGSGDAPGLTAQQQYDDLLDAQDVLGKRIIHTRLRSAITIREGNATAALEVMSRFAINPKWLVYLPPTMSPCETSQREQLLEHPTEAFDYYRTKGIPRVICEEKHMGSRAVVVACRSEDVAAKRFGVQGEGQGVVYTRTGRRFTEDRNLEAELIRRIDAAMTQSGLWDDLETDWVCLDCELMPWSVKAQELLRTQYAATSAAARASLKDSLEALGKTTGRRDLVLDWNVSPGDSSKPADPKELFTRYQARQEMIQKYEEAYRGYCWPVSGVTDLKLAPFHIMATEGVVHTNKDHDWHMNTIAKICDTDPELLLATRNRIVDLTDPESVTEGTRWWEEHTSTGGEGMVVKPMEFCPRGGTQPAVKVRGREYLRIIYGPEYTAHDQLPRLKSRNLRFKRSLALREFALGIEALDRFVRCEPLRRVHECVFGVLALESEPVDPRL